MFLTRLTLNVRDNRVLRDLAQPYQMHRTLMNSYPYSRVANRCDLLFRTELKRDGAPIVLVQTQEDPGEWRGLPTGYQLGRAESKRLDLSIEKGQQLRFRIRANPTKRVAKMNPRLGSEMAGKRIGLATEVEQLEWLIRKGEAGGFTIPGRRQSERAPQVARATPQDFSVALTDEGRIPNGKPGFGGEFVVVRFDGLLMVTDPEAFRSAVAKGIGSGKAFGCGMLSLARGSNP